MLNNFIAVIISEYVHASDHHTVYLKLNGTHELYLKKTGK